MELIWGRLRIVLVSVGVSADQEWVCDIGKEEAEDSLLPGD